MNKELSEILLGFKRTIGLMEKPEKISLFLATFLMLVTGILTNLPAVILGKLVDRLVGKNIQFTIALPFIGLIILIIIIREALTILRKYLVENIATQTEKKQTVIVINHLLKTDISFLNDQQIGSLHGRIFRSIQGLIQIIKLGFLEFFPTLFTAGAALFIALSQKPILATIMALVIPTGLFIIIKQISSQKGIRVSLIRGKEKIDGTVVETLGGIETVRTLNTETQEVLKVEQVMEESRKKEIKHHIFMALFDSGKYLNEGFFYILVISFSILLSTQKIISQGDILVYSILFLSITGPLREIHRILDQAHESSIRVNDLYDLLNQPQDVSFKPNYLEKSIAHSTKDRLTLRVEQLSFSYPKKNNLILNDVSFKVKTGEKIGIVGVSGSGKSTLIRIFLRLIHNYSGDIYLFGKNLNSISRKEISEKIAYIPQKTYIFSGTIEENIIYGCLRKIYPKEIVYAAKKANIYDEIINSLGGLKGRVSENGNNLSGGQKQRLAIARLILKSPELFIFDEATSALDNTNEAIIQKNIEQLFKNKTIIIIAHRLTTLKNSHRILVFDKGKIVQEGNFKELSHQLGLFQNLLRQKSI
ncbi:ABC transporter ATP-binding protein [Candidatus Roizmanbacteria bacterium]|nr:ABC transporter ATP-binding protein [Candidatus Roizmanbacteria bacterium]